MWHPYLVFCNQSLIASFPTEELRDAFIKARKAMFPNNYYGYWPGGA